MANPPRQGDQPFRRPHHDVCRAQHQQDRAGLRLHDRSHDQGDHDQQQHLDRQGQVDVLEVPVPDGADHQHPHRKHRDPRQEDLRFGVDVEVHAHPHQRRHDARGARDGKAREEVRGSAGAFGLDVEPCQPHGAAGQVQERQDQPRVAAVHVDLAQREGIGQHGRRHPERQDVRQGVQLDAELGFGARHARDPSVQTVGNRRHHDGQRGATERLGGALHAPDHRQQAEEDTAEREEVGQDVLAFAKVHREKRTRLDAAWQGQPAGPETGRAPGITPTGSSGRPTGRRPRMPWDPRTLAGPAVPP